MAKKKQKIPEKKASMKWVYAGLAVLVIAGLAVYIYSGSNSDTNTSSSNDLKEKIPTAGKFGTMNKPCTYEPGKVKITEFLKFNCSHTYRYCFLAR